jgi:gamma-glutamyl hercynylcysteine S-oxide synthase
MLAASATIGLQHELLARLQQARAETDRLFDHVRPEFLYERPIPERHRIVFYVGHLEAFDWNLLRERVLGRTSFHSEFDNLFAFGIDPIDGGLPSDQPSDWPSLTQVRAYVSQVRQALDEGLVSALSQKVGLEEHSPNQLLNVAIEHRLMHAETLAYMLHQLPFDNKVANPRLPELVLRPVMPRMLDIPAGQATLGLARCCTDIFGWDNEYEEHTVAVPPFSIDQYEVTNREYLQFMSASGYEDQSLWSESDWKWRTQQNISHPVFWNQVDDEWQYRTMFEDVPLPLDWPVYVSHAEASAYARWAGKSLPTEAQWHRAAYGSPVADEPERPFPWGEEAPHSGLGNFDFDRWDPTHVGAFPHGKSAFGVTDLIGNGWEWTATPFTPFPGFQPFEFYPGYSANFFDGGHYIMKGGSARTAARMLRRSFRNWFQPHYQYVYAGFRCVSA